MVGEVMFYGPGAGKLPTASAVVADIIDAIMNPAEKAKPIVWTRAQAGELADFSAYSCRRMLVFRGEVPAEFSGVEARKSGDSIAVLTDAATEEQADGWKQTYGDALLSAYRVL